MILLTGDVTTTHNLNEFGRIVFALACVAMLWSATTQAARLRKLRELDTAAARDEIASLRMRHFLFRLAMLVIALISVRQG